MKWSKLLYEICRDIKIIKYVLVELYKKNNGKFKGKTFVECADEELERIGLK